MTKSDLVFELAERAGITRVKAALVVDTVFDSILDAMKQGRRVEFRGFGTFVIRNYEAYVGRNPKTGEEISIPEKRMPFFKPGRHLQAAIRNQSD